VRKGTAAFSLHLPVNASETIRIFLGAPLMLNEKGQTVIDQWLLRAPIGTWIPFPSNDITDLIKFFREAVGKSLSLFMFSAKTEKFFVGCWMHLSEEWKDTRGVCKRCFVTGDEWCTYSAYSSSRLRYAKEKKSYFGQKDFFC
jgi:hypothetical protein